MKRNKIKVIICFSAGMLLIALDLSSNPTDIVMELAETIGLFIPGILLVLYGINIAIEQ